MNEYLVGILVMAGMFMCGYRVGYIRGWRNGYNDYGSTLEQKSRFRAETEQKGAAGFIPRPPI